MSRGDVAPNRYLSTSMGLGYLKESNLIQRLYSALETDLVYQST